MQRPQKVACPDASSSIWPCHLSQDGDKCKFCRRLTALDPQIKRAQAALQTLLDEREALIARHDQDDSSIFDGLPVEVASDIFTFYVSELTRKISPFVLGAVCQKWRQVAWSTPYLWSTLSVRLSESEQKLRIQLDLMEDSLNRSGDLPLAISIDGSYVERDIGQVKVCLEDLIYNLNDHSERWYILELRLPLETLELLNASGYKSPRLDRLCLYTDDDGDLDLDLPTFSRFSPRVLELDFRLTQRSLNMSLITQVDISRISVHDVLLVLQSVPKLRQGNFKYITSEDIDLVNPADIQVTLLHLKLLEVGFYSHRAAHGRLFDCITLPALEHLDIQKLSLELGTELFRFFTRSSCKLRKLILSNTFYPVDQLIRTTELLPTLEELRILDAFGSDLDVTLFLRALDWAPSIGTSTPGHMEPLLPSLRIFEWHSSGDFPWEGLPYFSAIISSEVGFARRPIESVIVRCQLWPTTSVRYIDGAVLSHIAEFKDTVHFDLTYDRGNGRKDLIQSSIEHQKHEDGSSDHLDLDRITYFEDFVS